MDTPQLRGHYFDEKRHNLAPCAVLAAVTRIESRTGTSGRFHHPFWVLDYTATPAGSCKVEREAWLKRPANVAHLYPPETSYWEDYTDTPSSIRSLFTLFTGGESLDAQAFLPKGAAYARFLDPDGLLKEELETMATECHARGEEGFWSAQARLFRIADILHSTSRPLAQPGGFTLVRPTAAPPLDAARLSARVAHHLRGNLEKPLTLAALARQARVSVSTLSHTYRAETGESPMRTLAQLRINLVKGLLAKGENLKTIAERTGFYDEFHLSKTFKRITGLSPRAFLKRGR